MTESEPAVWVEGLSKWYESRKGAVHALEHIDLQIHGGEFVSFVGPSGCGKSTLLKIIAGLEEVDLGTVRVRGEDARAGRSDVGIMLQSPVLLPWRTVMSNLLLPAEVRRRDRKASRHRAAEMLELVGLADAADKYGWELSGGMQQRVSLARLLALDCDVMLLDEPFSALDEFNREKLTLDLAGIHASVRRTAIYVTHSIAESVLLSDRVVVLKPHPGEILEVVDVDLPRPRDRFTMQSPRAQEIVQRIRNLLFAEGGGVG